jgi:hypothetical protein
VYLTEPKGYQFMGASAAGAATVGAQRIGAMRVVSFSAPKGGHLSWRVRWKIPTGGPSHNGE